MRRTNRWDLPIAFRLPGFAAAFLVLALSPAAAQASFSPDELACRAVVTRSAAKLAKSEMKVVASCHRARSRDGSLSGVDCNDPTSADLHSRLTKIQQKVVTAISSPTGACAAVEPADVLYQSCPFPCASSVPSMASFNDVAECLLCMTRENIRTLAGAVSGSPASPLPSDEARCQSAIASGSSLLFQAATREVALCQIGNEAAGGTDTTYCTDTAYPDAAVDDARYDAENMVVNACDLSSFDSLDSCATSAFGLASCVGDASLGAAQDFASEALTFHPAGTTTTTTSTTSTTLPPDPQCPNLGELVLYSHDSNISCTTNADCPAPRTCDATAGICVSRSNLDSGWSGLSHNSDLDEGVIQRSKLVCPGPAPTCGECRIDGIDPSTGSCRCSTSTRTICDEPFAPDADDCGGAICDCYFGVPIPLSSAGTPACIVNRYASDISGTANVDDGSSSISAKLTTRVYLGITTTNPCPICGGTCSNSPTTACTFDSNCGAGNTCVLDTPNDGIRGGLCIDGNNAGLPCDVAGTNPSFPARSGGAVGGSGYSLDCLPSVGKNISGQGLELSVTQKTGTSTLEAHLPCSGGNCPCKTCSASPLSPCNSDGDCTGGSCAISSNFQCNADGDCKNLNLGNCSATIHRCQLATAVACTNNADCQHYPDGGPCQPSTCTSQGGSLGLIPQPNGCFGGVCDDAGNGIGVCDTGPDDKTCDGLVRANGKGILSCTNNNDCAANDPLNGKCTLVERRPCFLDPIVATGSADPHYPTGAAAFCVPPTSNSSINQVAGLPGPARVLNQGRSRALCTNDPLVEYQAGVGGCP
jgi:hypothetical protein